MSDNHLRLTEKETICPHCREEYRSLSKHWGHKPSHRPPMDYLQHAMAAGLVLGECSVGAGDQTPVLDIRTQYPTFAVWLYENLGWLANTIHRNTPPSHSRPEYIVRTVAHPDLDRYRRWRTGDTRPSAAETIVSPYTVRVWVAKTAGVGWSGPSHSRTTRFHAETEARHRWYGAILAHLGYEPYDSGVRFELDQSESRDLFDRSGAPVPGVGHKWLFDSDEYEYRRRSQRLLDDELGDVSPVEGILGRDPRSTGADYTERDIFVALRDAASEGVAMSAVQYDQWRARHEGDIPAASTAKDRMRWTVWRSVAGLDPPEPTRPVRWSETACLAALHDRYGSADALSNTETYRRESSGDEALPSLGTLQRRFGSWDALRGMLADFIDTGGTSRRVASDTEQCPCCGARTTVEPHFPKGTIGQQNRVPLRGCHACGWHENQ